MAASNNRLPRREDEPTLTDSGVRARMGAATSSAVVPRLYDEFEEGDVRLNAASLFGETSSANGHGGTVLMPSALTLEMRGAVAAARLLQPEIPPVVVGFEAIPPIVAATPPAPSRPRERLAPPPRTSVEIVVIALAIVTFGITAAVVFLTFT